LGLFDYAQSKFPLGLFGRKQYAAIEKLEKAHEKGRYVVTNALFALQMIYFENGNFDKASAINEQLYQHYPQNLGCLYNRALLKEKQNCFSEALLIWERIILLIKSFESFSNGYLAECHYHIATIYRNQGNCNKAWKELIKAAKYAGRHYPTKEMDGPYTSFKDVKKKINKALQEWRQS
jgi:tetratricopeptide (TPR) repeat protein